MSDNLCEMINTGDIDFENFLKMHPFSVSRKLLFLEALEGIDYFRDLYVKSIGTYLRLASISKVLSTKYRNLVVLTGYKGCGKTNFLKYIQYIANGNSIGETLLDTKNSQINNRPYKEGIEEIEKQYTKIIDKIHFDLSGVIKKKNIETIELNNYIQRACRGKTYYINFDIGGYRANKPLSTKLYLMFQKQLKNEILPQNKLTEMIDIIDGFVKRNTEFIQKTFLKLDSSIKTDTRSLSDFWDSMKIILTSLNEESDYKQLLELMRELSLSNILLAYFVWMITWLYINNEDKSNKQIFLFDNTDIISDADGRVFKNTIFGIFSYVYGSRILFTEVFRHSNNQIDKDLCTYYDNLNLIVSMRETSAMMVSDHARKIIKQNMEPFDIYNDIDRSLLLKRKLQLGRKLIDSGRIENELFISQLSGLEYLLQDSVFMERLFLMNNNDVRTSDQLLSQICYNLQFLKRPSNRRKHDKSGYVFGMRGGIYKKIFELYFNKNYFKDLKIVDYRNIGPSRTYNYSFARVLLVILNNKAKGDRQDRILFHEAQYVELKNLYNCVSDLMTIDEFVSILDRMYSLRNEDYWNHLITFDNVASYSKNVLTKYIKAKSHKKDLEIFVCITPAGIQFLEQICVHFEYFSVRFADGKYPGLYGEGVYSSLFAYNCFAKDEDLEKVTTLLQAVFDSVKGCNQSLRHFDAMVRKVILPKTRSTSSDSLYYFKNQKHTERLCFHHIQYLNAYRRYLIDSNENNKKANELIIDFIISYLNLLKHNTGKKAEFSRMFMSFNSANTYNALMVCVEKIIESDYEDTAIDITVSYYEEHYKNEDCELKKRSNS